MFPARALCFARFFVSLFGLSLVVSCGGGSTAPAAPVSTISVGLSSPSIPVGQTATATATLRDASQNILNGREVTWTSSNENVATVTPAGVVTGVAFGSVNIVATAEGKTGQAALAVNVSNPAVQGVSLLQSGVAANLQNVAGNLTVDFELLLPSGASGALVVKLDSVEYLRQNVSAPAGMLIDAAEISANVVETPNVILETAKLSTTFEADAIRALPFHTNGLHTLRITYTPNGGSEQTLQQTNLTTNNPPIMAGLEILDGPTATGSDSKLYRSGSATIYPALIKYGNEVIQEWDLTLTDARQEYRSVAGSLPNYFTITRTNFDKFTIPKASIALERADLSYIVTRIRMDGVNYNPQQVYFGNSSYTADLIGSGIANTTQQIQGRTPPQGLSYARIPTYGMEVLPNQTARRLGIDPFNADNLGPRVLSQPAMTLRDRVTTVGQMAMLPSGGYGNIDNFIGANTNLLEGIDATKFTDVNGIDLSKSKLYYTSLANTSDLFNAANEHADNSAFTESNGVRNWVAGSRVSDPLGNLSVGVRLQRSSANPFNINGQTSGTPNDAALAFSATKGTISYSGTIRDNFLWNKTSLSSLNWMYVVGGATAGMPFNWISGRATFDGIPIYGAGPAMDEKAILPASGGTLGGVASLSYQSVTDLAFQVTGRRHGVYEYSFTGRDKAGQSLDGWMGIRKFTTLWDPNPPAAPVINIQGDVIPGATANATLSGSDDIAMSALWLGLQFDLDSPLFSLGKVYVPLTAIEVGSSFDGMFMKNFSTPMTGLIPKGFRFFNNSSGAIDMSGMGHRTIGATLQSEDFARNLSPITTFTFPNTMNVDKPADLDRITFNASGGSNLCRGTGCAGGLSSMLPLSVNVFGFSPTGPSPISKAEFYALSQIDQQMYFLGKDMTPNESPSGGGRQYTFNGTVDMRNYCGPAGPVLLVVIAYAADGLSLYKNGTFPSRTIAEPPGFTSFCQMPRVPLNF